MTRINFDSCGSSTRLLPRLLIVLFTLLFLSLLKTSPAVAQEDRNTLFLPLKINTQSDAAALTELADRALLEALADKGMFMAKRDEAVAGLDYTTTWPPPFEALLSIPPPAGTNYVVAGSLTKLGRRISIDTVVFALLDKTLFTYFYQEADSTDDLPAVMNKLVTDILAYTSREALIGNITVKGNKRIDTGAIMRRIKSQAGDRFNPDRLREELKNIFAMGFFENVQIHVAESDKGKEVLFEVTEKEVIGQVLLENNKKLDDEDIREVLTVAPNNIINPKDIKDSVDKIKKLYKEKGYYNTEVATKLTYPKEGRVDVRFVIEEGIKVFIKEITFAGNTAFKDKKLRRVVETSEKGFFSWVTDSGVLKRDIIEQDAARIGAFYHNYGYIEARVGEPEIKQEGEWFYITFNIFEGDRYKVGAIDLAGDLIEDKNVLFGKLEILREDFFSRNVLRKDIMTLSDYYAEKGYAYADIDPSVDKNSEDKTVSVTFNIRKKELVHINRIIIKGNTRTRDKVIRREMAVNEQEIFDATALRKSHKRLQRLEFFEDINITPEPAMEENLMDIIVDVKEKPTGNFSIGAGYSSVDSFMFMAEVSQNNFLGRGQRIALQGNFSSTSTQYNVSFAEPHLNDTELLFGFDFYDLEREYEDYTKDSQGGGLRFGYPIWEKWAMHWGYGYDNTTLIDVDRATASQAVLDSMDIEVTSFATLGFVRDTRNRQYNPTTGSKNTINVKYAGGSILGGDSYFTKLLGSTSHYYPFYFGTTFHLKASAGYVTENTGGELPIYEKFYLGGINTIRGFKSLRISPRDPLTGDRIGGEKMGYYNAEIIFPLVKEAGLNGVVFFDAGNVYEKSWDLDNIKKSAGFGFRWLSPVGPLRLEWGYNLDRVGDEDQSNWDFNIGGAF